MTENCTWRTITIWQDEPADAGWHTSRRYRRQQCVTCGQTRDLRPERYRRRYRVTSIDPAQEPQNLRRLLPPKRWRMLDDLVGIASLSRPDLVGLLEEWLYMGWVVVEEQQDIITGRWHLERVRLSDAAHTILIAQPQAERLDRNQAAQHHMLSMLTGWREDLATAMVASSGDMLVAALLARLESICNDQERGLQVDEWAALPGTKQRLGGPVHRRWLLVIRGLLDLLARPRWEYERTFAARWLGDSKALGDDRKVIADYLELPEGLERVGLFRHTPVVACWGPWIAYCGDRAIDGMAGVPFVALAGLTIPMLTDMRVDADAILVIENQTAFETLLRAPLRHDRLLYLFSSGFPGYAERELLACWLRLRPLSWWVWTDWDAGGVRIQEHWRQWAEAQLLPAPYPWMWDTASLERWGAYGRALKPTERTALERLTHPLADRLLSFGYQLEQERALPGITAHDVANVGIRANVVRLQIC
jgi:hypothetical protein